MLKIVIDKISKERHVKDAYRFLDVQASFVEVGENEEETIIGTIKRGYPISTTTKEIRDDLKKARKTFIEESEQKVVNAEVEREEKSADKVIKDLEGSEIKK